MDIKKKNNEELKNQYLWYLESEKLSKQTNKRIFDSLWISIDEKKKESITKLVFSWMMKWKKPQKEVTDLQQKDILLKKLEDEFGKETDYHIYQELYKDIIINFDKYKDYLKKTKYIEKEKKEQKKKELEEERKENDRLNKLVEGISFSFLEWISVADQNLLTFAKQTIREFLMINRSIKNFSDNDLMIFFNNYVSNESGRNHSQIIELSKPVLEAIKNIKKDIDQRCSLKIQEIIDNKEISEDVIEQCNLQIAQFVGDFESVWSIDDSDGHKKYRTRLSNGEINLHVQRTRGWNWKCEKCKFVNSFIYPAESLNRNISSRILSKEDYQQISMFGQEWEDKLRDKIIDKYFWLNHFYKTRNTSDGPWESVDLQFKEDKFWAYLDKALTTTNEETINKIMVWKYKDVYKKIIEKKLNNSLEWRKVLSYYNHFFEIYWIMNLISVKDHWYLPSVYEKLPQTIHLIKENDINETIQYKKWSMPVKTVIEVKKIIIKEVNKIKKLFSELDISWLEWSDWYKLILALKTICETKLEEVKILESLFKKEEDVLENNEKYMTDQDRLNQSAAMKIFWISGWESPYLQRVRALELIKYGPDTIEINGMNFPRWILSKFASSDYSMVHNADTHIYKALWIEWSEYVELHNYFWDGHMNNSNNVMSKKPIVQILK